MAVGDYEIARFNLNMDNFQDEDTSVVNQLVAQQFPVATYDDLQYTLIYRSGGGNRQIVSIMVGGARKIA